MLFFLIFPDLIRRLEILSKSRRRAFSLGFVLAMIFYRSLNLDFMGGGMGRSISSKTIQVSLLYIRT